ncbi:MAG: hypothetical protein HC830_11995 [Bacteroidetes bacterium]|nr:hypothetical protein [Bacteroidota bacterium]
MKLLISILLLTGMLIPNNTANSQEIEQRTYSTSFTSVPPEIDGFINDDLLG